jgi:hypothetical protein
MKLPQNANRMKVMFIKAHWMNDVKWNVGHKTQMRKEKAEELIRRRIVEEYSGPWPPKIKTKINLKDLK